MKLTTFIITIVLITATLGLSESAKVVVKLPPMETLCIEPIELENVTVWVPAAKAGPLINQSCRAKGGCDYSFLLPALVKHEKTEQCPGYLAKILAELTSVFHRDSLPLTILNGWQWEFMYSLSQFQAVKYSLPSRGGSWENCWEAVMTVTCAKNRHEWLHIKPTGKYQINESANQTESKIKINSFSHVRTRDGYPKERKL